MDFNQVKYFLALAETLNFTRAAEQCNVSQPALTQGIKRLEDELGGPLITRDGRYTQLTVLGHSLHSHFEQINRTRHLVSKTAKEVVSGEVAELNIGIMCTIGPRVLGGLFNVFQKQHPMTSVIFHDVIPEVIPNLLLTGALDGVFCSRRGPAHPEIRYHELFEETVGVAFAEDHPYTAKKSVSLSEIGTQPYIDRLHCEFRQSAIDYYSEHKLDLNVVFSSERDDWIEGLVKSGAGITVIPQHSIMGPGLVFKPITEPGHSRTIELALAGDDEISTALSLLVNTAIDYDWPS
ncbi:MAG: LysR family transcriptional regulator [Alphaproteobacteria bacterium]|nr:LysR family transcriptional regulator [Alphaproteobacteria bacterium]